MSDKKLRICVITFHFNKAFVVPLSNLEEVLCNFSDSLYVITGGEKKLTTTTKQNEIQKFGLIYIDGKNTVLQIIRYIIMQIKISLILVNLSKKVDTCIFFMEAGTLLPIITAKLLRKRVILALPSSILKKERHRKDYIIDLLIFFKTTNYILCDYIILHSMNLINEWDLGRYKNKILIAHEYFLDFDKFRFKKSINEREMIIGYIGRLSEEKGIFNFVKSIPKIIENNNNNKSGAKFLIIGDGPLKNNIIEYINENKLNDSVRYEGWISHDKLPDYINKLKLLVIPSYTESGPIIALEAMACGTPIIATRVGHILNMIKDGETGFVMDNNSPECIAQNVKRAFMHSNLDEVGMNSRKFVEKEFNYEVAVSAYKKILEDVQGV